MFIKVLLIGVLFASAPVYIASSQDPTRDQEPLRDGPTVQVEEFDPIDNYRSSHAAAIEDLERRHAEAVATLEQQLSESQRRAADLARQLEEALDFVMAAPEQHNSCKPSRRMMTHYRWLRQNGHEKRAALALDHVVQQVGNDNSNLNRAAWQLMTDKDTTGDYDELALALTQRMQKNGHLDHRQLDTTALARFLNGDVQAAIDLQKQAIKRGGNSDDYRRRLRTYQAAMQRLDTAEIPTALPAAKPARKISDDD